MVKMTLRRYLWCLVQLAVGTLSTSEYLNIPNAINLSVIIQYITWDKDFGHLLHVYNTL